MNLQANDITIGYGSKAVFSNITFSAGAGDMIALLGVNGIGKSTLLKTLCGLQPVLHGTLQLAGKELRTMPVQERAHYISLVLTERIWIDHITVRNFIELGRAPYTGWGGQLTKADIAAVEEVINLTGLFKLLPKLFNELSDGERQKVLIARALCQATPIIILDEPTAFLDFRNKQEVLELLRRVCEASGKTVILSTHDIDKSLELCTKCWVMTEEKTFTEIAVNGEASKQRVKKTLGVTG